MSDPYKTIYAAEPHTKAKHAILRGYLKRWLLILDKQGVKMNRNKQRLLIFDAFAGAGQYLNNVPGSPLVAIDTVLEHGGQLRCPTELRLVELDKARAAHLTRVINEKRRTIPDSANLTIIDPIQGDCTEEIQKLLEDCSRARRPVGPAFFFLDQFGYSAFSMGLVASIMQSPQCEVFSYLNWNLLYPFMADEKKHAAIDVAFGGDEWRQVIPLKGKEKEDRFRDIYLAALRTRGGARYAYPFSMRDSTDQVIYWLFFCSNHRRGLEVMKTAMWEVDRSGGFQFSDKHVSDHSSMFTYSEQDLARQIVASLDGKTLTVKELIDFVLMETAAFRWGGAFGALESQGNLKPIAPPAGRKARSFSEHEEMKVLIRRTEKQGSLLDWN